MDTHRVPERFAFRVAAYLSVANGWQTGFTRDVSERALYIRCVEVPAGEEVTVTLLIEGMPIEGRGRSIRCDENGAVIELHFEGEAERAWYEFLLNERVRTASPITLRSFELARSVKNNPARGANRSARVANRARVTHRAHAH